jgi:hypothetical protein
MFSAIVIPVQGKPRLRQMEPKDLGIDDPGGDMNAVATEVPGVLFWYSNLSGQRNEIATTMWQMLNPSKRGEPLSGRDHLVGTVTLTGRRDIDHPASVLQPLIDWLSA